MYGVVTRNEEETRWPEFDRAFFEVKDVTGRSAEPVDSRFEVLEEGVRCTYCDTIVRESITAHVSVA